jgi:hypothetical protein
MVNKLLAYIVLINMHGQYMYISVIIHNKLLSKIVANFRRVASLEEHAVVVHLE